jgi:hypothetical protein
MWLAMADPWAWSMQVNPWKYCTGDPLADMVLLGTFEDTCCLDAIELRGNDVIR